MKRFSVMTFGSVNRGDNDKYSDNDLLIVFPNDTDYDHSEYSDFVNNEYSISYYNYEKLEYVSKIGNLFIQHLKQQGEIVSDESGRLKEILNNYRPRSDYRSDLKDAFDFKSIFTNLPVNSIANGWVFDLLYIAVRNYLVFYAAVEGVYKFGYKELLSDYSSVFNLTSEDVERLLFLRIKKQAYRNRPHFLSIEHSDKNEVIESCEKIIGSIEANYLSKDDFSSYVKKYIGDKKLATYNKFRLIEGLYNCNGKRIPIIENIVSNPQFYSYQAKKKRKLMLWYDLINDAKDF